MNSMRPSLTTAVVDVHWHHVPKRLLEGIVDGSCPYSGNLSAGPEFGTLTPTEGLAVELAEPLVDLDRALGLMGSVGIDLALASLAPPLMQYDVPLAQAEGFCRYVNDSFADIHGEHSERFLPLATYHCRTLLLRHAKHGGPSASSVRRRRNRVECHGQSLGDDFFLPFWEVIAELDTFVFVHGIQSSTWLKRLAACGGARQLRRRADRHRDVDRQPDVQRRSRTIPIAAKSAFHMVGERSPTSSDAGSMGWHHPLVLASTCTPHRVRTCSRSTVTR